MARLIGKINPMPSKYVESLRKKKADVQPSVVKGPYDANTITE
jgi:hypothetical protein